MIVNNKMWLFCSAWQFFILSALQLLCFFAIGSAQDRSHTQSRFRPVAPPGPFDHIHEDPPKEFLVHKSDIAKALGFTPSSSEFKRLLEHGPEVIDETILALKKEKLAHFKSEKSTVAFPPADASQPVLNENLKSLEPIAADFHKYQVEQFAKQTQIPPLPRCSQSTTEKLSRPVPLTEKANEVFVDTLFIGPEDEKLFKNTTRDPTMSTILYNPDKPSSGAWSAANFGVSCLPYRLRVTGLNIYKHYGEDALKRHQESTLSESP